MPVPQKGRPKLWLAVSNRAPEPAPAEPPFDDAQLIEALRRGDEMAAAALYDRARPIVDRTVVRLLGRRDVDHDDIAQLAMIELVYGIAGFRGDCSLNSWCSTITAHVVYKQLRRRKLERQIFEVPESFDDVPSSGTDGGDAMIRSLMRRVRLHLGAIGADKAWTYLLHDVWGYDLHEIAQITGVSVAAAQKRLTRGRHDLHARIAADPELAPSLVTLEGTS